MIIYLVVAACVLWALIYTRNMVAVGDVRRTVTTNDDEKAAQQFIKLLGLAEHTVIVYDDGNSMQGGMYEDCQVIEAVREKLKSPGFSIRCCFNFNDDLAFTRELAHENGVEIRTIGRGRRTTGTDDVHYKIVDGGTHAYLSKHAVGSRDRMVKIVDCTGVSKWGFKHAVKRELGFYMDEFERNFRAATPSSPA